MTRLFFCLVLSTLTINSLYAQFYPYNPSYALGQMIGQSINDNKKYGRNKLKKTIKKWDKCKNGTLSLEHGAIAIYGQNGYFCTATVPNEMKNHLESLNKKGTEINDVNITEGGYYVIIYNSGRNWFGNVPSNLENLLKRIESKENIRSCSFNDNGIYAVVTNKSFYSNNQDYIDYYDEQCEKNGECYSVNICENGAVFCHVKGCDFCGYVPDLVSEAMLAFSFTDSPKFVKYNSHGDYLICSQTESYDYNINNANQGQRAPTSFQKPKPRKIKSNLQETFYYASYGIIENYKVENIKIIGDDDTYEHRITIDFKSTSGKIFLKHVKVNVVSSTFEEINNIQITPEESTLAVGSNGIVIITDDKLIEIKKDKKTLGIYDAGIIILKDKGEVYVPLSIIEKDFPLRAKASEVFMKSINSDRIGIYREVYHIDEVYNSTTFDSKYERIKQELLRYPWKVKK